MTTLRVRVAAPPSSGRAESWALFSDAGGCVRTGRDIPATWPNAQRIEIVIAASQVRVVAVTLPPLPPARVAQAAAFALEDQLAGPSEAQHLAVSAQSANGQVRVAVVARALMSALTERAGAGTVGRVVAEPELAATVTGWRWCIDAAGDGFVRRPDSSAFPVSAVASSRALPVEIAVALAEARRGGALPESVRVDGTVAAPQLERWTGETGVVFEAGTPWRWETAPAAAFAAAINLRQGDFAPASSAVRGSRARLFAPAFALLGAALLLHVGATLIDWGALKIDAWRQTRAWSDLAGRAGVPADVASDPAMARAALARRYADLRHASGLPAPDDALPLLARAAPALSTLPPGAIRSATYGDGRWTLDLARADAAQVNAFDARLRADGLPAVVATSANGTRVRLGAL